MGSAWVPGKLTTLLDEINLMISLWSNCILTDDQLLATVVMHNLNVAKTHLSPVVYNNLHYRAAIINYFILKMDHMITCT